MRHVAYWLGVAAAILIIWFFAVLNLSAIFVELP